MHIKQCTESVHASLPMLSGGVPGIKLIFLTACISSSLLKQIPRPARECALAACSSPWVSISRFVSLQKPNVVPDCSVLRSRHLILDKIYKNAMKCGKIFKTGVPFHLQIIIILTKMTKHGFWSKLLPLTVSNP